MQQRMVKYECLCRCYINTINYCPKNIYIRTNRKRRTNLDNVGNAAVPPPLEAADEYGAEHPRQEHLPDRRG